MINSIKDLKSVSCGGEIIIMDDLKEKYPEKFNESGQMDYKWFEEEIRPNYSVYVRHDVDSISFSMMTRPASEGGKGCQFTDLIEVALHQLQYFHAKFPCDENIQTIVSLHTALIWQNIRTKNREKRGVEGKNEK